jgi:hypothetical protein
VLHDRSPVAVLLDFIREEIEFRIIVYDGTVKMKGAQESGFGKDSGIQADIKDFDGVYAGAKQISDHLIQDTALAYPPQTAQDRKAADLMGKDAGGFIILTPVIRFFQRERNGT